MSGRNPKSHQSMGGGRCCHNKGYGEGSIRIEAFRALRLSRVYERGPGYGSGLRDLRLGIDSQS